MTRLPLRWRVPLLLMGFAATIALVTLQWDARSADRAVERDARMLMTQHMTRLQGTVEYLVSRGDVTRVQAEVAAFGSDPRLSAVFVMDEQGRVLAATDLGMVGERVDPDGVPREVIERVTRTLAGEVSISAAGRDIIGVYPVVLGVRPDELRGANIGIAVMRGDLVGLKTQARRAVERHVIEFGAFVAGMSVLVWGLFHLVLTRRINRLIAAAGRLAGGDLTARAGLTGRDEVAAAGRAFDRMAEDLAASRANLQASEARFRRIAESNMLGIYFWETGGRVTEANDAFLSLVGYGREDVAAGALRWTDITPPEHAPLDERALEELRANGVCASYPKTFVRKNGARVPVLIGQALLEGSQDTGVGFVLDLTERERMDAALQEREQQLRQAQKMEAVGRLAGSVAHDFNNLLTVILGHGELLRAGLRPDDPNRRDVDRLVETAQRAAALTRQLLSFGRRQVVAQRVLDLNAVVRGTEHMLRRLIGEHIEIRVALAPTPMWVKADPGQLEQVIMNLAVNARDAMPQGGLLTIETAEADDPVQQGVAPAVMLAVRDTGCGMDDKTQTRLFEPFFTTKALGHGTGLGLSTVYSIVEQSRGSIRVHSEPGRGTTMRVCFPRADGAAAPAPELSPVATEGSSARETVLLAEDDEAIRDLMVNALRRGGYTVISAGNAREALQLAEQHPGPIHLLITDVIMPQMTGAQLARRITHARPATRVLYVSGYTDNAVLSSGTDGDPNFLQKPFTPSVFERRVREVLKAAGLRPAAN
ncbi:MAG: ATP-binding protein [Nitrospirota bacterium]